MSDNFNSDQEIRLRAEQRLNKRKEFSIHLAVYAMINVALWAIWWFITPDIFPWPLIVSLGWGGGLAGHAADVFAETSRWATMREREVQEAMRQVYGDDWRVDAREEDYQRVRGQIGKDFNKRKEFLIHLSVYIPINLMVWLIWLLTLSLIGLPWPALVSLGWGVGLVIHGIDTYFQTGRRVTGREEAIQREIEREQEQMYGGYEKEKRKRDRLVLSDDGELVELVEEEWSNGDKRKRR